MKRVFTFISFVLLLSSCSSNEKSKMLIGKWKTDVNRNNSQITMSFTDSTILTEFWFDEGIKKIQYKYIIEEETDSFLVLKTTNYFNITTLDTIIIDAASIKITTEEGIKIKLMKVE